MIKKILSGHYAKLLLFCIVTICTSAAILFTTGRTLIKKREENDYLKSYDIALSNLSSILSSKEERLYNTLAPVYSSNSRYQTLCHFFSDTKLPEAKISQEIIPLFSEICRYDNYCKGILAITKSQELYYYNIDHETITALPAAIKPPSFVPYELSLLSQHTLQEMNDVFADNTDNVYGLSSTISNYNDTELENLGQLIVLYSTSEFGNYVNNANLNDACEFSIMDKDSNIIFASNNDYADSSNILVKKNDSDNKSYQSLPTTSKVNSESYYHATYYNGRHSFYTHYQLPARLVSQSYSLFILGFLSIFICLVSILLYIITLLVSDKKINSIQKGMSLVGHNNLDYRLPVPKGNDEFTQIILSFNHMYDELQKNVEKAYLYEISEKKAELYAMQISINPHFLYNTLEQIRFQITKGAYPDASNMLILLSRLYRSQTRRNLYISIGEELNLCENLINLYMYRYENFEYEFIIGNALKIYGIPKNTLQPLIENYFVHGLVSDREDNVITVSVQSISSEGKELLEFTIENNGYTISDEDLKTIEQKLADPVLNRKEDSGFALSNVNIRLKIVFGEKSGLSLSRCENGTGFRIRFIIPPIMPEDLV